MIELLRALGALVDPPTPELQRVADVLNLGPLPDEADHTDLFLFQLPPFASIYLGAEGKLGGDARDRIAGFWRAVGLTPPPEPDGLSALLGLYANLAEAGQNEASAAAAALLRESAGAVLSEHLAPWLGAYLSSLDTVAPPFYRRWADLLATALRSEADGLDLNKTLPAHLRDAPSLADPRSEGGAAFLDALLAPVRVGMVLTRTDLARAAATTQLGLRAGERRYAIEALFSQDPAAILTWLRDEAVRWAERHEAAPQLSGPSVAAFWSKRAGTAQMLLTELIGTAWEGAECAP